MTAEELRELQAPLKQAYRQAPETAQIELRAAGRLHPETLLCCLDGSPPRSTGLHPSAGGDGSAACAAEMLLEAIIGCAGVTLCAVATAMDLSLQGGQIEAVGVLDVRGTLGVDRTAPVGFRSIELAIALEGELTTEQLDKLVELTERYCVVLQTLKSPPTVRVRASRASEE